MYIKRNVNYCVFHNENVKNKVWLLAVKVRNNFFNGTVVAIYHSPSQSDPEFIQYFKDWYENKLNEDECNLVVGFFNLDLLSGFSTVRKY